MKSKAKPEKNLRDRALAVLVEIAESRALPPDERTEAARQILDYAERDEK